MISTRHWMAVAALMIAASSVGRVQACQLLTVDSHNMSGSIVTGSIQLDTTPADNVALSLAAGASHSDMLDIPLGSANMLTLKAQVTDGSLSGSCQAQVINQNNLTGCSGVIDPKYFLTITKTEGNSTTPPSDHHGKGKGNAWGTYKHCFKTKADWAAFKSNPANGHMGTSDGWCLDDKTQTAGTLTCSLAFDSTF